MSGRYTQDGNFQIRAQTVPTRGRFLTKFKHKTKPKNSGMNPPGIIGFICHDAK
jgi:hypothetical protein